MSYSIWAFFWESVFFQLFHSLSLYMLLQMTRLPSFSWLNSIPLCLCVCLYIYTYSIVCTYVYVCVCVCLLYPFIHWWTFWLFQYLGYREYYCSEHEWRVKFLWHTASYTFQVLSASRLFLIFPRLGKFSTIISSNIF